MKQSLLPMASLLVLLTLIASAQDSLDAVTTERPPIHFQVVKSWKADLRDHAIFLNQVAPPVLQPAPAVIPQANAQATGAVLRPNPAAAKKSDLLFLSATVQEHRFTEIRWPEDGRPCSAFCNIDFNRLSGSVNFETADSVYSLMLSVRNVTTDITAVTAATAANSPAAPAAPSLGGPQAARWQIPGLNQLSPTRAQYLCVVDESGIAPQKNNSPHWMPCSSILTPTGSVSQTNMQNAKLRESRKSNSQRCRHRRSRTPW